MFLGITTLLIAILISGVAAYYSILGLTAIFAAAAVPVIIMGATLEAGKVMTAIWLHRNWNRAGWLYKLYLVPAIAFLMVLTSMGVYGFLSKAHIEQTVPSGDVQAQVQLIDEKIQTQRDNIDIARKTLSQLNAAVDETLARSKTEKGAANADWIRKTQAKERTALQNEIARAQKEIVSLQEERAPLAAKVRKVEAEVGPIKYVAALLYGDNTDINMLEKAVRWVILLIVIVFDPLAIVLIIAGIKQLEWSKVQRVSATTEPVTELQTAPTETTATDSQVFIAVNNPLETEQQIDQLRAEIQTLQTIVEAKTAQITAQDLEFEKLNSEKELLITDYNFLLTLKLSLEEQVENLQAEISAQAQNQTITANSTGTLEAQLIELIEKYKELEEQLKNAIAERDFHIERAQELFNNIQPEQVEPEPVQPEQIIQETIEEPIIQEPVTEVVDTIVEQPVIEAEATESTNTAHIPNTNFGMEFPAAPERGDMCLRIDFKPNRLFKWNGVKWIEVNKNSTDAFSYNEQYLNFLADKLLSGEYTTDDLSELELAQVQEILQTKN